MDITITSIVALGGLFLGIYNLFVHEKQRKFELRWKKAKLAKNILDEYFSDNCNITEFLDVMTSENYSPSIKITKELILQTLKKEKFDKLDEEVIAFVDDFFYYTDRICHLIKIELIEFEDIKAPLDWFIAELRLNSEIFIKYSKNAHFNEFHEIFELFLRNKTRTESIY